MRKPGTDVLSLFPERTVTVKNARKRLFIKCCEHEEEAKQFAINHKVYMVHRTPWCSLRWRKDVINHLDGAPHEAAMERAKLKQKCNHPWWRIM